MVTLMMASPRHFSICSGDATLGVAQDSRLLKCDTAHVDEWFPVFQRIFKDKLTLHMKVTQSFKYNRNHSTKNTATHSNRPEPPTHFYILFTISVIVYSSCKPTTQDIVH